MNMHFTGKEIDRLNAVTQSGTAMDNIDDAAHYALLLGLKLIETGFDTDKFIRSMQEPGTGLDVDLFIAKKRFNNEKLYDPKEPIDWLIQNIPEDAYDDIEFDED